MLLLYAWTGDHSHDPSWYLHLSWYLWSLLLLWTRIPGDSTFQLSIFWCHRSMCLLVTKLISMVHIAIRKFVDIRDPCWCLRLLKSVAHTANQECLVIRLLWSHWEPCWSPWSMLPPETLVIYVIHVSARTHVYVNDPCCFWGPDWFAWFKQSPKSLLTSLISAASGNYVDLNSSCCHQRSCWCWRTLLPFENFFMSIFWTAVWDKVEDHSYCC